MRYQELNALLSDITGQPEAAITKDAQLDELGLDEEGYLRIAEEIGEEADADYIRCISSVGDLLDYTNGE